MTRILISAALILIACATASAAEKATYPEWKRFEYIQTPAMDKAFTWSEEARGFRLTNPSALEPVRRELQRNQGLLNRYRDGEPIFWYQGVRKLGMLRFYEEFGIDYSLRDIGGQTMVHSAALLEDNIGLPSLKYLVETKRLAVDAKDPRGITPYWVAACNRHGVNDLAIDEGFSNTAILQYLAAQGADTRVSVAGVSALQCAKDAQRPEAIVSLLENLARR